MIVIAHLSDTHIDSGQRSIRRTRAVMDYLEDLPYDLDAVLVTGDITDNALPAEYEQARQLLTSRHPVVICPGNHDERAAFRQHLLGQPATTAPINQAHHAAGFVVALCDSSVPGEDKGFLADETLAWLEDILVRAPAGVPVLVGFHHPPVPLHVPFIDGIRQFGAERLAAIADRHPNLTAFLCGHAHTSAATTFAGRPLLVAPGVVSTLRLPWEHRAHPGHHVHLDQPPALAFHILDDEGRLTTHHRYVSD
ncbi:3',5'-cyclic AMP phosphodiesterase CpdA [Streptosporangium becharense]|uniref:3',5'-cyclic AMP phosphodiesterase CpdA n=1 Tax=Streptosporangium becharense TaxID=1816182 RepID=A0A7W9IAS7_9ACTN|nr:metallophosphoesterase [Streptosporangium becharense]MBB2914221.1 3',5'-cyclic AMP phosphodiesterase CpdA [Streptosporangium becharense]MBB5817248.1 3',5'-cyclic AMP phosphodiesterase CpdA [Streptosporangium becharense]